MPCTSMHRTAHPYAPCHCHCHSIVDITHLYLDLSCHRQYAYWIRTHSLPLQPCPNVRIVTAPCHLPQTLLKLQHTVNTLDHSGPQPPPLPHFPPPWRPPRSMASSSSNGYGQAISKDHHVPGDDVGDVSCQEGLRRHGYMFDLSTHQMPPVGHPLARAGPHGLVMQAGHISLQVCLLLCARLCTWAHGISFECAAIGTAVLSSVYTAAAIRHSQCILTGVTVPIMSLCHTMAYDNNHAHDCSIMLMYLCPALHLPTRICLTARAAPCASPASMRWRNARCGRSRCCMVVAWCTARCPAATLWCPTGGTLI